MADICAVVEPLVTSVPGALAGKCRRTPMVYIIYNYIYNILYVYIIYCMCIIYIYIIICDIYIYIIYVYMGVGTMVSGFHFPFSQCAESCNLCVNCMRRMAACCWQRARPGPRDQTETAS